MSPALLAIQNIVQNSIFSIDLEKQSTLRPSVRKKVKQFSGFLPTSVSCLNPSFTKGGDRATPQRFFITFAKNKLETPKFA